MQKKTLSLLCLLVLALLAGCTKPVNITTPTHPAPLTGTLRLYPSNTPSATPLPTGYISPTLSPTITPTMTPVYYQVVKGDDMYGIAFRFGISPQELMTANPSVQPRWMSAGEQLLIPITPQMQTQQPQNAVESTPTPTLSPYELAQPDCYPDAQRGLWCFVLVKNRQPAALENVSGMVNLLAEDGTILRQATAEMQMNILPAGVALPLVAYFAAPVPDGFTPTAEISLALPVPADDGRYVPAEIQNEHMALASDGKSAKVYGDVVLLPGYAVQSIWVYALALTEDGSVCGVRRVSLPVDGSTGFDLTVYTLGGRIDQVIIVAEARATDDE